MALQGIDAEQRDLQRARGARQGQGEIAPQPSGGSTGYLVDPFGINWVVTINKA